MSECWSSTMAGWFTTGHSPTWRCGWRCSGCWSSTLWEPTAPLQVANAEHIGSELNGVRQRLAFSPELTTAARVLAEVSAQVEVRDLTLEEPAIEDIVRTLYHRSG